MTTKTMPGQNLGQIIDAVNPGDLFRAAIEEVGASVAPVIADNARYRNARVFERLLIPDRVIRFRVEWTDDRNGVRINTGWRIQHSNLQIGRASV